LGKPKDCKEQGKKKNRQKGRESRRHPMPNRETKSCWNEQSKSGGKENSVSAQYEQHQASLLPKMFKGGENAKLTFHQKEAKEGGRAEQVIKYRT